MLNLEFRNFNFVWHVILVQVFVTKKIGYHGQLLGLILAKSQLLANQAAKLVQIKYANETKPVIDMDKAIDKAKASGQYDMQTGGTFKTKPVDAIKVQHTIQGKLSTGSQYHFHMETQSVVCHPREDGIDVYSTSQWVDHAQNNIALALKIPTNSVNLQVRRVGGAFGGK